VLILLAALFAGATGLFMAARAELRIGIAHAASSRAFYLAEAGLATWLAGPVHPSAADYLIGGDSVSVEARLLLRVDSMTVLYDLEARAHVGSGGGDPGSATRWTRLLARRAGDGPMVAVGGSWREVVRP